MNQNTKPNAGGKFELPPLPFEYNALEPYIDAKTMEIHYIKHHQAYCDKFNGALEKHPELKDRSAEDILKDIDKLEVSDADRATLRNNGGGFVNHSLFWNLLDPKNEKDEDLSNDISSAFGSIDGFKKKFTEAAAGRFGSGWAWLVKDSDNKLQIYSTANQDSPISQGHTPIIGLDVWEHAYYLKYQNRRPEYIEAWWKVLKLI